MTTRVTIDVPDHVERVIVQTQSYTQDGWKDNEAFAFGPGTHWLHIYDTYRIACIVERPYAQDLPPNVIAPNES